MPGTFGLHEQRRPQNRVGGDGEIPNETEKKIGCQHNMKAA